jgi:hypothetical protein
MFLGMESAQVGTLDSHLGIVDAHQVRGDGSNDEHAVLHIPIEVKMREKIHSLSTISPYKGRKIAELHLVHEKTIFIFILCNLAD